MAVLALASAVASLNAQPSVLTSQYGNLRQSYNSQESVLISSNVKSIIEQPAFSPLLIDKGPGTSVVSNK